VRRRRQGSLFLGFLPGAWFAAIMRTTSPIHSGTNLFKQDTLKRISFGKSTNYAQLHF
jgi:hypothetical protein